MFDIVKGFVELIKKLNLKNHNFYDTKQNFQHHQIIQLLPFFLI